MKYLFETERLKMRELNVSDEYDIAQILLNSNSMKYYDKVFTERDVTNWIEKNIRRYKDDGFGLWAVIRKNDDVFLGDCGVTMQNIDQEILPEIGFHIKKAYCRHGYAAEAASGALHYVKATYHLTRIYSYCQIENIPSQGVMQKIGLQFMKTYQQGAHELIVYSKEI
jgi:RimJ/RimL family protein N-acetyltransferase